MTKSEHYIGIPTTGDIGILQEQLYSAEAHRLEIPVSKIACLSPLTMAYTYKGGAQAAGSAIREFIRESVPRETNG